jgi:hypothetical protein
LIERHDPRTGRLCGITSHLSAVLSLVVAARVNSILLSDLVSHYEGRPAGEGAALRGTLLVLHAANGTCTRLGLVAVSVAVALGSLFLAQAVWGLAVAALLLRNKL